jgi:tRNA(Ile)-lysidine synthetase-like protein
MAATAAASLSLALVVLRFYKPLLYRITTRLKGPLFFFIMQQIQNIKQRILGPEVPHTPASACANDSDDSTCSSSVHSRMNKHLFDSNDSFSLNKIRENNQLITHVLYYWFGQYASIPEALKNLWMVSAHSTEKVLVVDEDIYEEFGNLLKELSREDSARYDEWCNDTELYGYRGKLAAVVVLDQMSRHVHRHLKARHRTDAALPEQSQLDYLAFKTSTLLVRQHADEFHAGMIPTPQFIFGVMPYRHSSTIETVSFVQGQIAIMTELVDDYDGMVKRFRKATNRRMALLQDEARRSGEDGEEKKLFDETDILECEAFTVDMEPSKKHEVHCTIANFLADRGIFPCNNENEMKSTMPTPVLVSLSGGVDSMVIVSVLSYLVGSCLYNLDVRAVHIDYANRAESAAEAAFCERYCRERNVAFGCRRIEEVTRGLTARDEYEAVARKARFDMYRWTIQDAIDDTGANGQIGVFLGHHRGDLRENVLSNAHKGCGPLDLSGMTSVSMNDGVALFRPLLSLEKKDIFDYAHKFGVPYFKDTTPHWSTRGKLRTKLMPLLEEIYGEGSMNNLSNLAVESDACRELLHKVAMGPFLDQVEHKSMGLMFNTDAWKDQGLFFWKFVLRSALHSAGIGMFSDKSVASFLERVQANPRKVGWLQCRKDCGVYLREDGKVYVFLPSVIPWQKNESFECAGKKLDIGADNSLQFGPWKVTAVIDQEASKATSDSKEEKLCRRAILSMDKFMEGTIEYHIESQILSTAKGPTPLVFQTLSKATRPRCWKSHDLKLQEKLPIASVDDTTAAALRDVQDVKTGEVTEFSRVVIKVTLDLCMDMVS